MHAFPGANDVRKNQNILEDNHRAALQLTDGALLTANAMEQTEVFDRPRDSSAQAPSLGPKKY